MIGACCRSRTPSSSRTGSQIAIRRSRPRKSVIARFLRSPDEAVSAPAQNAWSPWLPRHGDEAGSGQQEHPRESGRSETYEVSFAILSFGEARSLSREEFFAADCEQNVNP